MKRPSPGATKSKPAFRVALIGTDSLRGQEIKNLLSVKRFPLTSIDFFDPEVEEEYSKLTQYRDEPKVIHHLDARALEGFDLVFLAASEETSRTYGRLASEKGFQAIDLTGAFSGGIGSRASRSSSSMMASSISALPPTLSITE